MNTANTSRAVAATSDRIAFALLGIVQATLIFTLVALVIPLPGIGRELGLERADLILVSTSYGLVFAGLLLLGGRLADRYGARRILTAGLIMFAFASAAAALAVDLQTLLAARFAQGAGAALIAPAAMALLRSLFPHPIPYGRALATWGSLSVIGAATGNVGSGVISALSSWRWTFAVPLVVALAALVLAPRVLPNPPPRAERRLDLPGAVLATTGVTLISYALVITDAHPWTSVAVEIPLGVGLLLLVAFVVTEYRSRDPLLPLGFLLDRRRAIGLAAIAVTAAATTTTFVLLSLHFQEGRGWSELRSSAAVVPFAVVLIAASRVAPNMIGRFGSPAVAAVGLGAAAVGSTLIALAGLNPSVPYAYGLLPGLVLVPAGAAAAFAGATVLAGEGVPEHHSGLAGGVTNTAMEFGPTVLFAIVLTLSSDSSSLIAVACCLAVIGILGGAMASSTRNRH